MCFCVLGPSVGIGFVSVGIEVCPGSPSVGRKEGSQDSWVLFQASVAQPAGTFFLCIIYTFLSRVTKCSFFTGRF